MAGLLILILGTAIAVTSASPTKDVVISRLDPGPRYQYMPDADGNIHLVDLWTTVRDLVLAARFEPEKDIVYHLFTRAHPNLSNPLLKDSYYLLSKSDFDPKKRTIIIIHGWTGSVYHSSVTSLVPAFLEAEDVNVIVVDWSVGADTPYLVALLNTAPAGKSVARFINWLNYATRSTPRQYHIVGHSLGGHQAGIVGRNVEGTVAYITALDPALPGWITNPYKFRASDGAYTEVIHTNAGVSGHLTPLGDVSFYPNGGIIMPGCADRSCHHARCYYYMAESIRSGGFTGTECRTFIDAIIGNCDLEGRLKMGGKTKDWIYRGLLLEDKCRTTIFNGIKLYLLMKNKSFFFLILPKYNAVYARMQSESNLAQ